MEVKLKIIQEGGLYTGYALRNNEVIFKTEHHRDVMSCTEALNQFKQQPFQQTRILSQQQTSSEKLKSASSNQPLSPPSTKPPRKCCGRG